MSGLKQQQVMISAVMLLVASIKLCFDVHVTPCAFFFFFFFFSKMRFSFIRLVPPREINVIHRNVAFRGLNLELDREIDFSVFYVTYKVSYTTKSPPISERSEDRFKSGCL